MLRRLVDRLRRWWRDMNDEPDYDPRPEDVDCLHCTELGIQLDAAKARYRRLEGEVEILQGKLDAASGLLLSHGTVEAVNESPNLDEEWVRMPPKRVIPLEVRTVGPRRLVPHTTTMLTVGTREPGYVKASEAARWTPERVERLAEESRAKRGDHSWHQTRMRVADNHKRTVERVPAPFGMTEEQAESNRGCVLTNQALRDALARTDAP